MKTLRILMTAMLASGALLAQTMQQAEAGRAAYQDQVFRVPRHGLGRQ